MKVCEICGGTVWLLSESPNRENNYRSKTVSCECRANEINERTLEINLENSGLVERDLKVFDFRTFKVTKQVSVESQKTLTEMRKRLQKWVKPNHEHWCLTLTGPTGVGKTHLAKASVKKLLKEGKRVHYSRAVELNKQLRNFTDGVADRYRDMLSNVSYLVLDDVGVEYDPRGYLQSIYHGVIDDRYNAHKPTVVISNLTFDLRGKGSLSSVLGRRAFSRLCEGVAIQVKGRDMRSLL